MLKNYFKIVLRNLWRYKTYTLINIIGLGIGIAAMVWGYQTYQFSFSFDNFHKDRENVFRGLTNKAGSDGIKGIFPMAAVKAAKTDVAGITETVRYDRRGTNIKSIKGETFAEQLYFTDPSFFDFFNFPLISGNNNLNDRSAVLITENMAKKYFGNEDAIGKLLVYNKEIELEVVGIAKNPPSNSSIQFDFVASFSTLQNIASEKGE